MRIDRTRQAGSLVIEAMVAIAVLASFVVSSLSIVWGSRILGTTLAMRANEIASIGTDASLWASAASSSKIWFDDVTLRVYPLGTSSPVSTLEFLPQVGLGATSCDQPFKGNIRSFPNTYRSEFLLGSDTIPTDFSVRNDFVYLTADSAIQARHDLYIYDNRKPSSTVLVSSIHTGPGLSALAVAGNYIYAANMSTTNQLQIIDISDRAAPFVLARLKLPLPAASSTAPAATAIAYSKGKIFLGTEKWGGAEFAIIDVSNPAAPAYISGIEIGSVVKSISVRGVNAYVATAGANELVAIDIRNTFNPIMTASFVPNGWQIEEGNRISIQNDKLWFGRAGGGFNTSAYQELFSFPAGESSASSTLSLIPTAATHVPGGVYGVVLREPYVFIASGDQGGLLDVWNTDLSSKLNSFSLGGKPAALACDGADIYALLADSGGFIRVTFQQQ